MHIQKPQSGTNWILAHGLLNHAYHAFFTGLEIGSLLCTEKTCQHQREIEKRDVNDIMTLN